MLLKELNNKEIQDIMECFDFVEELEHGPACGVWSN